MTPTPPNPKVNPEQARMLTQEFLANMIIDDAKKALQLSSQKEPNTSTKKPFPFCPECGRKDQVFKQRDAVDRFICQPCQQKFVVEGFDTPKEE